MKIVIILCVIINILLLLTDFLEYKQYKKNIKLFYFLFSTILCISIFSLELYYNELSYNNIKRKGLAKGGSLENAIVVKGNQILNEDGLRNRHEFVYHKILDCLGDIMLSGNRIFGHIITSQGGHALTNKLLLKFFSDKSNWIVESGNAVDKNNQIKESFKKSLSATI